LLHCWLSQQCQQRLLTHQKLKRFVKQIQLPKKKPAPKKFVKQIHECEYILSSSLHGIIIADSYGIPAYHIELSDKIIGGQWKFKDYYESVKRPYGTINISSMNEGKILKQMKPYKLDFDFDGYYQYIKDELNKVA
jgi:pyruvyltransferase